jgi:hypothetical protein
MPTQPTTNELEPLNRCTYDPEQVTTALTMVALAGGNCERAAGRLHEAGFHVHPSVLRYWRANYPNRYAQAAQDVAPQVEANVVHLHREIASQSAETVLKAIRLEERRLEHGKVENAARSAKDLSTAAAIAVDKVLALTGRPTSIHEHRTPEQAMKRLQTLHPGLFVEGTAEEIASDEREQLPALSSGRAEQSREAV